MGDGWGFHGQGTFLNPGLHDPLQDLGEEQKEEDILIPGGTASRVPSPCPGAGPRPAPRPQRLTCSSTPRSDEPKTAGWGRSPDLQTSKPPCSPPLPSGSKETLHQIFRDCCERVVQSFYRLGSLELCRLFVKCQMSKDKEKVIELSSLYSPPVTAVDFLPSGIVF